MKKALLFALAGLLAAVAPALAYPPPAANVNFASERGVPFGLVLDGRPLTRGVARQVHVDRLMPGQHWADFTLPNAYGGLTRFRSRIWLEPGLETSFVLIARPGRPLGLQQVQAVPLYGPGYPSGRGYYNSPTPYGQGGGYYPNDPYNGAAPSGGNYPNGGTYPNNGNYPPAPNGSNGSYPNNPNGNGYPNNGGNGNGYPNNGGGNGSYPNNNGNGGNNPNSGYYPGSATSSYRLLAPTDVNSLVQTMQQRITEVSKLNAAREGLDQRSLRAEDLTRLLRSLSSEACRIDLAKFALTHVSDPENFGQVYDAFETEAGAQALEQAVRDAEQQQR